MQKFHGGAQPDLADLDVYGVLQSARFLPLFEDIKSGTRAGDWLAQMEATLAQNTRQVA